MAKVHDKFVIELAEVIKGYGNDPDIDDPFHLSEFYRFYELPEIAVSANHFRTMIPLELEIAKAIEHLPSAQQWIPVRCKECKHRPSGTGMNHDIEFPDDVCPCQCEDFWYSWMPNDNWFCGNGERGEK